MKLEAFKTVTPAQQQFKVILEVLINAKLQQTNAKVIENLHHDLTLELCNASLF